MPDVVLFGATGYTGRLVAHTLAQRGADFAVAGRNIDKLEELASLTGNPQVRVASAGDVDALTNALDDARVLITCVGPFVELGDAAVEAALRARVHYIDSTGEGVFIGRLIAEHHERAQASGVAMAPAMGFDEVPADVAATLAVGEMPEPELTLTYALPRGGSAGTLRSALGIIAAKGPWIEDGKTTMIRAGQHTRWAPMPPPLGPRPSVSFPLAEGHLAPLHLGLRSLRLFITVGTAERVAFKTAVPALGTPFAAPVRGLLRRLADRAPEGPDEDARAGARWTILGEARAGDEWRNVWLQGTDPYGLTAEFLATAALEMSAPGFTQTGVLSPVQAVGLDVWEKELTGHGVRIESYGSR
jgi:short subunit dehydrogenase-like uncharacterized protein